MITLQSIQSSSTGLDSSNYKNFLNALEDLSEQKKESLQFSYSLNKRLYLSLCQYSQNHRKWFSETQNQIIQKTDNDTEGYYTVFVFEDLLKQYCDEEVFNVLRKQKDLYLQINQKDPLVKAHLKDSAEKLKSLDLKTLRNCLVGCLRSREENTWVFRVIR